MENIQNPQNNNSSENKEFFFVKYKEQLLQLENILDKIRSLEWKKKTPNIDLGFKEWDKKYHDLNLKTLFFRYLDGSKEEDKLKIYIEKIGSINSLEEVFSEELKSRFKNLFTEVFRLYAFSKLEPFKTEFEKVDFPFNEFEKSLELFKKTLKDGCDLELIIPNLYIDKEREHPELYAQVIGASHILASDLIPMKQFEKDKEPGIITDFQTIGFHSEKLGIDEKAVVYTYSKV